MYRKHGMATPFLKWRVAHATVTAQFWYWHNALGLFQYPKDVCVAIFFCSSFKISSESMPRKFYEWTQLISGRITDSHVSGCICVITIHDHCRYKFVNMTIERRSLVRQHTWWSQDAKHDIDLLLIQGIVLLEALSGSLWKLKDFHAAGFLSRPK